jgi:multiple sugar transport system substrate-binding protein
MKKVTVSRREFLKGAAFLGAGTVLASCAPAATPTAAPAEVKPTEAPAAAQATEAPAPTTAPAAAEPVSIRFVTNHGEADMPLFQTVIDKFAAKEPGIKIEHLDIADGNAFYDSINTQGAAKQLPDVWYTRTFDTPVWAAKNWTISLQDLVTRDAAEVNVADFWPAEVAQITVQGKLWALPYDYSNIGIYYNIDMFKAAGVDLPPAEWKWDDLAALSTKFVKKDASGAFTNWGMVMYTWNWVFMGLMYGWGGNVFSDDLSTCVINSKENADCIKYFIDKRKQGLYPEAGATPEGVDPFAAAIIPMSYQGSWATQSERSAIKDKFQFDCTAMPLSNDGKSCINAAGGAWGIAANTKDVEASWKWLKFLTSTESTNDLISIPLRSIPGRKSSVAKWNEVAAQGGLPPKNVAVFSKQMEIANAKPTPTYWGSFSSVWSNMIDPLLNGATDDDPAAVLKAAEDEVNRLAKQG